MCIRDSRYSAIYALALTFALKTSACSDFLQVEPTGSLTEEQDRKSTRLNSSHSDRSRMPSSA